LGSGASRHVRYLRHGLGAGLAADERFDPSPSGWQAGRVLDAIHET
jgi:hypothetical protein